jgi:hypothetical protein
MRSSSNAAVIVSTSLLLTGCISGPLKNPPQQPILSCTDCGSLTYYGPPQRNPNVEMAEVLTGGVVKLGSAIVKADLFKTIMKESFGSSSSTTERSSSTYVEGGKDIERVTDRSSSVIDRSASTESDSTFVSDTSVSDTTFVSDTSSVSDSSVSTTLPSTTVGP